MRAPEFSDLKTVAHAPAAVQQRHPNATLAGGAGTLGTCIVWTATTLGAPMDATVGAAFATVFSSGALFIGRKGLKGAVSAMWWGDGKEGGD